jgi:hypothetical protein
MQYVLRRRVRNDREPERSVARGAKQNSMGGDSRIRGGHQPWLAAIRFAFGALRPRRRLPRGRLQMQRGQRDQHEALLAQLHLPPAPNPEATSFNQSPLRIKPAAGSSGCRPLVLFRYNRGDKLMHKIHMLTDN